MPRRTIEFQTVRSEGGLIPPDLLRRLVDPAGKLPGTDPASYGLPAGDRLNEAITQSWSRLRRHWSDFRSALAQLPPGEARTSLTNDKWSLPLLRELGFGFLPTTPAPVLDDKAYAISRFAGSTPIHLVGCGVDLDRRAAGVRGASAANPHGLVQEFLNRSPNHLWAILSNGLALRILRDNQALSRQSFVEFNLVAMFDGEAFSDFVLLWLTAHASRFLPRTDGRPESCWLEAWSKEAAEQGVAALTDLRGGVEKALQALGQGFVGHPRNAALRDALRSGQVQPSDFHHQLLRVVYRIIFLFVAEDRELEGIPILHPRDPSDDARVARERYAAHYGTSRLRDLASRIKGSRHGDLWRQFQLLVGALSGDPRFAPARNALALPALGSMLWNPNATALLNGPGLGDPGAELSNHDFLEALRHLAFIRKDKVLRPVDYKNLGSEEFGGVYESFLALTPQVSGDGARFTFAEFAGNERKTSGSYYTPDSLVQCLLDSALDPVVEARLAEAERLAKLDWPAVLKETEPDSTQRAHILAFLTEHAGAPKSPGPEEQQSAWESIPPVLRRWHLSSQAILGLKACDMACGSGHFLVGAAHRLARHLARARAMADGETEPSTLLYQTALRDVIGHCLYGVDINPMAVELCKVTLWLEALEPGKPLSFLDHHIRCGNSLLGATPDLIAAGLPDEAFDPIEGDDKAACNALRKLNRLERDALRNLFVAEDNALRDRLRKAAADLNDMDDSRPEDIQRKEATFHAQQTNYDFQKAWDLANLWCAAFVIRKRFATPEFPRHGEPTSALAVAAEAPSQAETTAGQPVPIQGGLFGGTEEPPKAMGKKAKAPPRADAHNAIGITTRHLRDLVAGGAPPHALLAEARQLASQYEFFHWHLAFPEVFAQGGFDLSLGNPPWERVKLQEKEWFSAHGQDAIANAPNAAARQRLIQQLQAQDPALHSAFLDAARKAEGESHLLRNTGLYPLCACGDINLYAVFAEGMRCILARNGRAGAVLPSGIATDDTTKFFFQDVVDKRSLASIFDFENKGIFPSVHSSFKFCLFTSSSPASPGPSASEFVCFAHGVEDLRDPERRFTLTAEDIARLNPNTRTCPIFRSRRDAELTKAIYTRVPVLIRKGELEENPWGIRFNAMFHMSNDSHLFRTREQLEAEGWRLDGNVFRRESAEYLPLYEAKMLDFFDHRSAHVVLSATAAVRQGQPQPLTETEHQDSHCLPIPRCWVHASEVTSVLDSLGGGRWLLGLRDVTSATNERTVISAALPRTAVGNNLPLLLKAQNTSQAHAAILLGSINSFALDFTARFKVGGLHLNFFIVEQLPVLDPATYAKPCPWYHSDPTHESPLTIGDFLMPRVLELTYTAWDLESFARDCGWEGPPFRWDEERRFLLRCELDAAFFHLYLGTEEEWRGQPGTLTASFPTPRDAVSYIMDTFPIVRRKDEERFNGDYRTKRVILEIYDALATAMKTSTPYPTRLTPPPADPTCCHPSKEKCKDDPSTC